MSQNNSDILKTLKAIEAGGGGGSSGGALGAVYYPTPPSLASGASTSLITDQNGSLNVSQATLLAGEDLTNNVLRVERYYSNTYVTLASLTVIKSAAGFIHDITVGHTSNPTLTIYDNTAGSGSVQQIFGAGMPIGSYVLDVPTATGISFVFQPGIAPSLGVGWR